MAARDEKGGESLKFPRWLCGLCDQGHALPTWNGGPVLLFVDQNGVWGEPEKPNDLGMIRCTEEDDLVPLLNESSEFTVFLRHPGASPVDHLKAASGRAP
jgi:hypothetical protein